MAQYVDFTSRNADNLMHVCFLNLIIERYSPVTGGALATVIMQTARGLEARGHQVSVLTAAHSDPTYNQGRVVPLRTESRETLSAHRRIASRLQDAHFRWDWPYYEHYAASYVKALRALSPSPDAVITLNDLIAPYFIRKAVPNTRIIASLHNEVDSRCRLRSRSLRAIDHAIGVSNYICDWARAAHLISPDRITSIPNGCDPSAFFPRDDYLKRRTRQKVLFIGRLNHEKGPDLVADAVAALRSEGLLVDLSVAGAKWWFGNDRSDPYVRELMIRLEKAGGSYLGLVGRGDVPALIRDHDVVCVPSRWKEPFGLVTTEAMASGCAVVASNRGGLPEVCGDAAMVFDPSHPEELTGHLRQLCLNADLLMARKQASLKRALSLTWDHNVDLLEQVCMGHPVRPGEATVKGQMTSALAA